MGDADTSKKRWGTGGRLIVPAVLLLVVALTLGGLYFLERSRHDVSAADTTVPDPAIAVASSTSSTSPSTTTSATAPSTTTLPPATESTTSSTTSTTQAPSLTVAAGGDVQGDRAVGSYIDVHGGPAALGEVAPYLRAADLAFVNLEGPISDKGTKLVWKEYTFRSRLALAYGLASAGIDVVSTANNHAADCGPAAVLDTIARLDRMGVEHAGSGEDLSAARAPALIETLAGRVAVLAFTDKFASGFAAGTDHAGVAPVGDGSKVLEAIAAARRTADYVIVSFHWGIEYDSQAAVYQQSLAHRCIDAGADLILGHHPHVIQGLEVYKDKLIAYSLGDFVFDHRPGVTGQSFILRVTLRPGGPPVAYIIPVYLSDSNGIPAVVTGSAADTILDRLARLSKTLGVTLTRSGDVAWLETADASH